VSSFRARNAAIKPLRDICGRKNLGRLRKRRFFPRKSIASCATVFSADEVADAKGAPLPGSGACWRRSQDATVARCAGGAGLPWAVPLPIPLASRHKPICPALNPGAGSMRSYASTSRPDAFCRHFFRRRTLRRKNNGGSRFLGALRSSDEQPGPPRNGKRPQSSLSEASDPAFAGYHSTDQPQSAARRWAVGQQANQHRRRGVRKPCGPGKRRPQKPPALFFEPAAARPSRPQ